MHCDPLPRPSAQVLVDAENTSPYHMDDIMLELSKLGSISIKRCYGDFAAPQQAPWKAVLLKHGIIPVQQYQYTTGKGSSDMALVIDAMDLLYTRNIDALAICSSDSDFTRLASRLREGSKIVYGVGRRQTPQAFKVVW
ncbi:limkain-b1-type NYN domain-containing protein [Tribonema minus]|uniref:Limkain-b1-type NYN domain-containing protein n=1 Tax=Tribonema minus TaxID=303371 RepID=A0A835ZC67_9STRA|nr:limkain-b1-type NYN domain-containing protein [Tribonema minus]